MNLQAVLGLARHLLRLPKRFPVEVSEPEKPGSWLIFTDNQGVGQALAERFKAYEQTPILISHSETYQHVEANRFQLNPTRPEHIQQLIETVRAEQPACRGIIHLWSLDTLENTTAVIESAQTLGCLSVLYLVQALAQVNWENTPQLWLVTQATQTVGDLNSPFGCPVCSVGFRTSHH
ncbi:conserved hypothetical protein [Beggiatoa sp. SS]|nr:conserved hypothetical protein [Beggiatoa sp. SS]